MNTSSLHRTTTAAAAASTIAAALTILTAVLPSAASAQRPDSCSAPDTHTVSRVAVDRADIDQLVADRKAQMSQYFIDHASELSLIRYKH